MEPNKNGDVYLGIDPVPTVKMNDAVIALYKLSTNTVSHNTQWRSFSIGETKTTNPLYIKDTGKIVSVRKIDDKIWLLFENTKFDKIFKVYTKDLTKKNFNVNLMLNLLQYNPRYEKDHTLKWNWTTQYSGSTIYTAPTQSKITMPYIGV